MIIKTSIRFLIACLISAFLIFSIPILNLFINGSLFKAKEKKKTEISIRKDVLPKEQPKKEKPARQPKRANPNQRNVKAGPRFAMDLGVASLGAGAAVSMDLVKDASGSGFGSQGDVDEKPKERFSSGFKAPDAIREAEIPAQLRMGFCVDANGKAFDIRIIEETPTGMGLAQAGREKLEKTDFEPAIKDGNPVPFCGMELPVEIKWTN
jgi:protein TonB